MADTQNNSIPDLSQLSDAELSALEQDQVRKEAARRFAASKALLKPGEAVSQDVDPDTGKITTSYAPMSTVENDSDSSNISPAGSLNNLPINPSPIVPSDITKFTADDIQKFLGPDQGGSSGKQMSPEDFNALWGGAKPEPKTPMIPNGMPQEDYLDNIRDLLTGNPPVDDSVFTTLPGATQVPDKLSQLKAILNKPAPEDQDLSDQSITSDTEAPNDSGLAQSDVDLTPEMDSAHAGNSVASRLQALSGGKTGGFQLNPTASNPLAALLGAQQQRSQGELVNQLGAAANLIGSSLARVKPVGQELFQQNIKAAGQPVQELEERLALEKKDPNSAYSQGLRQYLQKFGIDAGDNVTGEIAEKVAPWALTQYDNEIRRQAQMNIADQNRTMRENMMQQRTQSQQERQDRLDQAAQAKASTSADNLLDKRFEQANKLISSETASSRSQFGQAAKVYAAAERIQTLANSIDPNNLDSRQITEIARNVDSMLSNGASTISGTNKLIPSTGAGDVMHLAEYITNIPKGAQQGDFVNRLLGTVTREKDLAKQQMQRTQGKLLAGFEDLAQKDPERFRRMLQANDIPPDIMTKPMQTSVQQTATPETKIAVRDPSGRLGKIPASQLQAALAQGYTLKDIQGTINGR